MKKEKRNIGLLVGKSEGGRIENCHATGKIIIDEVESDINAGGLVGHAVNTEIINSTSDVEVQYSEDKIFNELKELIKKKLKNDLKLYEILGLVDSMNSKKRTKDFLEHYTNFISLMANHMTLISPYIPFLTDLILK
jgi:hypothetical protein